MAIRTISAKAAQRDFDALLDDLAAGGEPVRITRGRRAAVLVSEEEWLGLEETLFLLSIPGMGESIREGMRTPLSELTDIIDW